MTAGVGCDNRGSCRPKPTVTVGVDPATLLTPPPTTIGRFTIVGEIGRGANGIVFAARDPVLGRDVAIKAIPLTVSDRVRQRAEENFIKEARAAAGLNHPHIVTVFDAGKTDTLAYIAMERLHGRDLHEYLYVGSRLGVRQAAALMARIADAVHYAHKRGLIHRDIKPSNIFLSREMKPKVLDFGVALPRSEVDPTQHTQLIGTPNYMSPEQALGKPIDARSDIFSLGTILYEMVTGKRAFDAPNVDDLLAKLVEAEPEPVTTLRPDTPPEMVRIISKALAKNIDQRYETAGDFRNDLAAFAGQREMDAQEMRVPQSVNAVRKASRRRWSMLTAVAISLSLAIGLGLWLAQPGSGPSGESTVTLTPGPAAPPSTAPVEPPTATGEPSARADAAGPGAREPVASERKRNGTVVVPPSEGLITLAIAPWGEVLVDGEARGISPPLTRMSLPPGSYCHRGAQRQLTAAEDHHRVKAGQTQTCDTGSEVEPHRLAPAKWLPYICTIGRAPVARDTLTQPDSCRFGQTSPQAMPESLPPNLRNDRSLRDPARTAPRSRQRLVPCRRSGAAPRGRAESRAVAAAERGRGGPRGADLVARAGVFEAGAGGGQAVASVHHLGVRGRTRAPDRLPGDRAGQRPPAARTDRQWLATPVRARSEHHGAHRRCDRICSPAEHRSRLPRSAARDPARRGQRAARRGLRWLDRRRPRRQRSARNTDRLLPYFDDLPKRRAAAMYAPWSRCCT